MASDQLTGAEFILFGESPAGNRKKIFSGVNEQIGPGGSPDGVQATTKDNELPYMNVSPITLTGGFKIVPSIRLKTADGMDASDCVINIPILVNGSQRVLTREDLGVTVDLPAASPTDLTLDIGTGWTVPQGQVVVVGGGKSFISIEDDA